MSPLAPAPTRHHIGDVSERQAVLRRVLEESPGSLRELAREAGLSHSLLVRIRDGERRLTPEARAKLAGALRRWASQCTELADALVLEAAAEREGGDNE